MFRRLLYKWHLRKVFREVKYFSRSGKTIPTGVYYVRGAFIRECRVNSDAFMLSENMHRADAYTRLSGGVIVFRSKDHSVFDNIEGVTRIADEVLAQKFKVGRAFQGSYDSAGEAYNSNSITIEIDGLSSFGLLCAAEIFAYRLHQSAIIVKDLNTMRIYAGNFNK